MLFNPLEQFDITVVTILPFTNLAITNIAITGLLNFFFVFLFLYYCQPSLKLNGLSFLILFLFNFVYSILKDSISLKKCSPILLFFYLFLFIFVSNIFGMIPYSITITSHLILTLYLSLSFFVGTNIIGALYHKEKYFVLFLPEGIPLFIIPGLILIEYISYFSKIFSLAIRLFANMMSGHILLKILIGFSWALFTNSILTFVLGVIPFIIVFFVIGLEFAIAFLQAYVFTILLIIYLNDVINTH